MHLLKPFIMLWLFLLAAWQCFAQKGEFHIRAGAGLAAYSTLSTLTYNLMGTQYSESKNDGATSLHYPLEIRYGFSHRFTAGLEIRFGSYFYDPEDAEGKSNLFMAAGPQAEFNLTANETFRWYLGAGFNIMLLELIETRDAAIYVRTTAIYAGEGLRLNSGILWFFSGHFGLHGNVAYIKHALRLKSYLINAFNVDLSNATGKLNLEGADIVLGLVFRF